MDHKKVVKLLKKLNVLLESDLNNRFNNHDQKLINYKQANNEKQNEFIDYLISVATHSIGLRASSSPFNESQEHILAYIMEMFSISNTNVENIINRNMKNKTLDKSAPLKGISTIKRHSWRPEMRIRLNPPLFQQTFLDNLTIRVYLFKEEQITEKKKFNIDQNFLKSFNKQIDDIKNKTNILERIFHKYKLESSLLIRPINELRTIVKFHKAKSVFINHQNNRLNYTMAQVINDKKLIDGDIRLKLRRYYCEPETVHILRFEFWLNTKAKEDKNFRCINNFKKIIKRLVFDGGCFVVEGRKSSYMNENQEFYGYINIKLTQLPSYAIKQNFSILSIEGRKLNNCEISLEPRNRRILEDGDKMLSNRYNNIDIIINDKTIVDETKVKKSKEKFLINHLRLYAICLMYQFKQLVSLTSTNLNLETIQSVTIDNLFYIPAFTLINQHRLQSNLNQLEDQCLRRVAILNLLINLNNTFESVESKQIQCMLISVMKNEYLIANRLIDEKTLNEIDPFLDSSSTDHTVEMELLCLNRFVANYLNMYLEKYFVKSLNDNIVSYKNNQINYVDQLNRAITLSSLNMFKLATMHYKTTKLIDLKLTVQSVLRQVIVEYVIKIMMENLDIIDSKIETVKPENLKSWPQLLDDLKNIDHNLKLYWTSEGLNKFIINETDTSDIFSAMFEYLEKKAFRSVIEAKVDKYLKRK